MLTTLFPTTFIAEPAVELLPALFGPLVVYQPLEGAVPEDMKRWEAAGRIRIRIPVRERSTELLKLSKSYRLWVEAHSLSTRNFLNFQIDADSPRESSSFTIRDEVRQKLREDAEKSRVAVPLTPARLFLHFAQENDLQQTEIQEQFKRIEQMEIDLFGSLKGEPPDGRENCGCRRPAGEAPDPDLLAIRRKAWSLLLAQDSRITSSYVTLSKAAFEEVLDDIPSAFRIPGFDPEPLYVPMEPHSGSEYKQHIDALAESAAKGQGIPIRLDDLPPVTGETRQKIRLTLRVVRDKTPLQVFLPKEGPSPHCRGDRLSSNTLIWHAECCSE